MSADHGRPVPASAATRDTKDGEGGRWGSTRIDRRRYHTEVRPRGHASIADEPLTRGGAPRIDAAGEPGEGHR